VMDGHAGQCNLGGRIPLEHESVSRHANTEQKAAMERTSQCG
jgi:hypothetical protein